MKDFEEPETEVAQPDAGHFEKLKEMRQGNPESEDSNRIDIRGGVRNINSENAGDKDNIYRASRSDLDGFATIFV